MCFVFNDGSNALQRAVRGAIEQSSAKNMKTLDLKTVEYQALAVLDGSERWVNPTALIKPHRHQKTPNRTDPTGRATAQALDLKIGDSDPRYRPACGRAWPWPP